MLAGGLGQVTGAATYAKLFNLNHRPQRSKLPIADASHHHQVLLATKRPVLLAMYDDSLGNNLSYSRKALKFRRRGGVDVYP